MKFHTTILALLMLLQSLSLIFCGNSHSFTGADLCLVDPDATKETQAVFFNLRRLAKNKLLIGHQNSTDYGIGWKNEDNRSDVRSVTGSYPAVYGWDMAVMDNPRLPKLIRESHARGGINTISWHMKNPVTGGPFSDTTEAVKHILHKGQNHEKFKETLDRFVTFLGDLKDDNDHPIPLIFRPWHENTGDWFWWGTKSCTAPEFIELWQFTVKYLRDTKNVHNLLYAYSPSQTGIRDKRNYLTNRFPGEEYMDIIGIDHYYHEDPQALISQLRIVVTLAEEKNKIPALTETGVAQGLGRTDIGSWFTMAFLEPIKRDPVARRVAYALFWRNARTEHFWVPYPGHRNAPDFKKLYDDPFTVFEDHLPDVYSLPMKNDPNWNGGCDNK
jgi:mannan endo-1,4-beta-mannosidase